jgi:hypothetical protein
MDRPGHVRSLPAMLTDRRASACRTGSTPSGRTACPSLRTLAAGIDRDHDVVVVGLTPPWRSGAVEGHVNRIKAWVSVRGRFIVLDRCCRPRLPPRGATSAAA